jgi:hypothetical protein
MVTMAMTSYARVTVAGVELDVMTSSPQLDALPPTMHFGFAWLAMANSCIKFVFYVLFDSDFREGLRVLYSHSCCKCVG